MSRSKKVATRAGYLLVKTASLIRIPPNSLPAAHPASLYSRSQSSSESTVKTRW
jgi:hypothetical protein